jgi:hypothetical protein
LALVIPVATRRAGEKSSLAAMDAREIFIQPCVKRVNPSAARREGKMFSLAIDAREIFISPCKAGELEGV